jgi:hypothetical protein
LATARERSLYSGRVFRPEGKQQHYGHHRQLQQEHRIGVGHPFQIIDQKTECFRVRRIVEELLPVADHDGVAGAAGRRTDAGHRGAVTDRKENYRSKIADLLAVVGGQGNQGDSDGQHHRRHRMLADERSQQSRNRRNAEANT